MFSPCDTHTLRHQSHPWHYHAPIILTIFYGNLAGSTSIPTTVIMTIYDPDPSIISIPTTRVENSTLLNRRGLDSGMDIDQTDSGRRSTGPDGPDHLVTSEGMEAYHIERDLQGSSGGWHGRSIYLELAIS
jgi:hypothetical protein